VIVVLEGPDFAGKSTIARALIADFGGEVVANGQPPRDVALVEHYVLQVITAAHRDGLTVFDRLHVGELIYGPLFRSECRLSEADVQSIEAELDRAGAMKLHVNANDSVLLERLRGPRGDDLVSKERDLLEIAAQYRRLLGNDGNDGNELAEGWLSMESTEALALASAWLQAETR